jgi:hypothetical protein
MNVDTGAGAGNHGDAQSAAPRARRRPLELVAVLLLVVAVVPIAFPYCGRDFAHGHDASAHLTYLHRFDRALAQRQFPVRWVEGSRPGWSQPLFNFYQVGFYYLVELVHLTGVPLSASFRATPVLLAWLGTAFMFLLLKPYGVVPAIGGAVMFALSPYTIVDLFVRAAYPEFAAIVFGVGVLWALDRTLTTGSTAYIAVLAILVALTLIAHLPAVLIMVPMFVGYSAWRAAGLARVVPRLIAAAAGVALGVALAAFYIGPALLELPLIQLQGLTRDYVDFRNHFVPPRQWFRFAVGSKWQFGATVADVTNLLPVHISLVQWAVFAAALALVAVPHWRKRLAHGPAIALVWLGVAGVAMWMMTAAARPVWEHIPALAYIQFPWRFFLLLSIAGAALTAIVLAALRGPRAQLAALLLIVAVLVHWDQPRLRPVGYLRYADWNIDNPRWNETAFARNNAFFESAYDPAGVTRATHDEIGRWSIVSGAAQVQVARVADHALALRTHSTDAIRLRINSRWFPEWRVRIDGREMPLTITPELEFFEAAVPAGDHLVTARLENTVVRTVANATSAAAAAVLLGLVATGTWRRRQTRRRPAESCRHHER